MKKIGLTGNIGSGKTTVGKIFETLGVPIFNADGEAKKLMSVNPLKNQLIETFGQAVFQEGHLNKKYLSTIIFNEPDKRRLINQLVHPQVQFHFEKWCQNQNSSYIIKEAAILFESGTYKSLDAIICVTCPEAIRIERLLQRDGLTLSQIQQRIHSQWEEKNIIEKSDYILDNSGNQLIIPQVLNLHQKLQ